MARTASTIPQYPMPFTRVEIVVLSLLEGQLQVLLARRTGEPHAGQWALPGGVLRIDLDDTLPDAARRVTRERLELELPFLRQLGTVGGKTRDPRAPWALSVVYRALVPMAGFNPGAGKRIDALAWRPVEQAMSDKMLAFDHAELIEQAVMATRAEVERMDLPFEGLPSEFTLSELQAWCAQLQGVESLDKSSFRRKLAAADLVEPVEGAVRGGAFRPAQVYRRRGMGLG